MKTLFFKPTIPVEMHEIKELLEKEFPEYECSLFGAVGKGLKVKKSTFQGVRIVKGVGLIFVKKTPPTFLGALIDGLLFGIIGDIINAKMASKITDFLRDRYCQ